MPPVSVCAYVSGESVTCRPMGRWLRARPLEHRKGAEGASHLRESTVQERRPVPGQWPWKPGPVSRGPGCPGPRCPAHLCQALCPPLSHRYRRVPTATCRDRPP